MSHESWIFILLVSLFNGISTFVGYSMPKLSLLKDCSGTIVVHSWGDKGVPKDIRPESEQNNMTEV